MTLAADMATAEVAARARRVFDTRLAERRERERACALDFLVYGNEDGRHDKRCVHSEPCSRNYQPLPYPDADAATPFPEDIYVGSGIGLLYGLTEPDTPDMRRLAVTLAGWNLTGPRERLLAADHHATTPVKETT